MKLQKYLVTADEIQVHRETSMAKFFGSVVLVQDDMTVHGNALNLNMQSGEGEMTQLKGQLKLNTALAPGEQRTEHRKMYFRSPIAKLSKNPFGKIRIDLKCARLTDCDQRHPHHEFRASTAVISSDEKMELYNFNTRLLGFPSFYFPYIIKDFQYDWPWTAWEFGQKRKWGRFARFQIVPWRKKGWVDASRFGLDYRERRGYAYHHSLNLHKRDSYNFQLNSSLFDEEWKNDGDTEIEQKLYRIDALNHWKVDDNWTFDLEWHKITSRNKGYWDGTTGSTVSENLYSPPSPGGVQRRNSLLEEYFEDEYLHGKPLENYAVLNWTQGGTSVDFAARTPVFEDGETGTELRSAEVVSRSVPTRFTSSDFFFSQESGFGERLYHYPEDISDDDRVLLFGSTEVSDFRMLGGSSEFKVSRPARFFGWMDLTPYAGFRVEYYEKIFKSSDASLQLGLLDKDHFQGDYTEARALGGLSASALITGYFSAAGRDFKHLIQPSIKLDSVSGARKDRDLFPMEMNYSKIFKPYRLVTEYSIENTLYIKSPNRKPRLLYSGIFSLTDIARSPDEKAEYGENHENGGDINFNQNLFPIKHLRISSDWVFSSHHNQTYHLLSGIHYETPDFGFHYNNTYQNDLVGQNGAGFIRRHDIALRGGGNGTRLEAQVSFDNYYRASEREAVFRGSDDLFENYNIRNCRFFLSWPVHCLRAGVEYKYDFESVNSTLIFRFGPDIFGEFQPMYRRIL